MPPIHLSREIGVVGDNKTNTVEFIVPRMKGAIDLYGYSARIDIFPIDETEEPYFEPLVVDVPEQDDTTLTLNWLVKRRDTASAGKLYFDICFYEAIENGKDVAVCQTVKDFVIVNDGVTVGAENTLDPTGWELIIEKIIASGGEIGNCSVVDLLSDLYALTGTLGVVKNSYAVTDRVLDFDVEYDYIKVKDAPTLPAISDNIHYKTVTYNGGKIIQLGFDETTDEPYFCFILTIDDVNYLYLYAESAVSGSVALTNSFDSTITGWSRSLVTTEGGGTLTFGDFEAVNAVNIPILPDVTFTDNITPENSVLINTFFDESEALGARLYYFEESDGTWNQVGGSSSGNYTVESVLPGLSWSAEFIGSKFYMTYVDPESSIIVDTLDDLPTTAPNGTRAIVREIDQTFPWLLKNIDSTLGFETPTLVSAQQKGVYIKKTPPKPDFTALGISPQVLISTWSTVFGNIKPYRLGSGAPYIHWHTGMHVDLYDMYFFPAGFFIPIDMLAFNDLMWDWGNPDSSEGRIKYFYIWDTAPVDPENPESDKLLPGWYEATAWDEEDNNITVFIAIPEMPDIRMSCSAAFEDNAAGLKAAEYFATVCSDEPFTYRKYLRDNGQWVLLNESGVTGGVDGIDGTNGISVRMLGEVANYNALPVNGDGGEVVVAGDCWITTDTGHLWTYLNNQWNDAGKIVGDSGTNGLDGTSWRIGESPDYFWEYKNSGSSVWITTDISASGGGTVEVSNDLIADAESTTKPPSVAAVVSALEGKQATGSYLTSLTGAVLTSDVSNDNATDIASTSKVLSVAEVNAHFQPRGNYEDSLNKSLTISDSDTLYPTNNAVIDYIDTKVPSAEGTPSNDKFLNEENTFAKISHSQLIDDETTKHLTTQERTDLNAYTAQKTIYALPVNWTLETNKNYSGVISTNPTFVLPAQQDINTNEINIIHLDVQIVGTIAVTWGNLVSFSYNAIPAMPEGYCDIEFEWSPVLSKWNVTVKYKGVVT